MDMLRGKDIAAAGLADWRKLGQGLHARYVVSDFTAAARFVSAAGQAGDDAGRHLSAKLGATYVDLKLISDDAVYRDGEGTEHQVDWTTQRDVELAERISEIAAEQSVQADPAGIVTIELALDTANPDKIAPMWSALLTGSTDARGRGTHGSRTPRAVRAGEGTIAARRGELSPARAAPRLEGAGAGHGVQRHRTGLVGPGGQGARRAGLGVFRRRGA